MRAVTALTGEGLGVVLEINLRGQGSKTDCCTCRLSERLAGEGVGLVLEDDLRRWSNDNNSSGLCISSLASISRRITNSIQTLQPKHKAAPTRHSAKQQLMGLAGFPQVMESWKSPGI